MIHYNGPLSKRPQQQACRQRAPQALAQQWHAADCMQCKATLLGMPIVATADARKIGFVVDLTDTTVSVAWQINPGEPDETGDAETISYDDFEQAWRAALS